MSLYDDYVPNPETEKDRKKEAKWEAARNAKVKRVTSTNSQREILKCHDDCRYLDRGQCIVGPGCNCIRRADDYYTQQ